MGALFRKGSVGIRFWQMTFTVRTWRVHSSAYMKISVTARWRYSSDDNYKMAEVQSKQNFNFISYEWVDHIAVYNYMFRPLSAIVKLYYFLL